MKGAEDGEDRLVEWPTGGSGADQRAGFSPSCALTGFLEKARCCVSLRCPLGFFQEVVMCELSDTWSKTIDCVRGIRWLLDSDKTP